MFFCLSAEPFGSVNLKHVWLIKMSSLKILAIILTGLWLSMCTHTGSPDPAKPEKKETTENKSESRTSSPDTTESKQQESQGKSQTGQPPSTELQLDPNRKKPLKMNPKRDNFHRCSRCQAGGSP